MAKTDVTTPGTADEPASDVTLGRALKIAGETITPGASLILDGNVRLGVLHMLGAGLARSIAGPFGIGYLALNSYSKSTSGKFLHEHLFQSRS